MWIFYAIGSSFFAGITAILEKCGIKKTDSDVATAIRTVVVLLFSWLMVMMTGTWGGITQIDSRTLLFLILSGMATWHHGCAISMPFRKEISIRLYPLINPVLYFSFFWHLYSFVKGLQGQK